MMTSAHPGGTGTAAMAAVAPSTKSACPTSTSTSTSTSTAATATAIATVRHTRTCWMSPEEDALIYSMAKPLVVSRPLFNHDHDSSHKSEKSDSVRSQSTTSTSAADSTTSTSSVSSALSTSTSSLGKCDQPHQYQHTADVDVDDNHINNSTKQKQTQPKRSSMKKPSTLRRCIQVPLLEEVASCNHDTSSSSPSPHSRCIQFALHHNEIKEILPLSSLVPNPSQLWLQPEEYHRIKQKIQKVVQHTEREQLDATRYARKQQQQQQRSSTRSQIKTPLCTRGLEHFMSHTTTFHRRRTSWDSIKTACTSSSSSSNADVAQLYAQTTVNAKWDAIHRAHQDAQDAERHTRDIRHAMTKYQFSTGSY